MAALPPPFGPNVTRSSLAEPSEIGTCAARRRAPSRKLDLAMCSTIVSPRETVRYRRHRRPDCWRLWDARRKIWRARRAPCNIGRNTGVEHWLRSIKCKRGGVVPTTSLPVSVMNVPST